MLIPREPQDQDVGFAKEVIDAGYVIFKKRFNILIFRNRGRE